MKKTLVALLALMLLIAGCGQAKAPSFQPYKPLPPSASSSGGTAAAAPHGTADLPVQAGEVVEISEKLFIAQTNDIYLNGEDYIGKTIKYEGIYKNTAEWEDGLDDVIHFVIRYGPGCCGYDGEAGFEVRWGEGAPAEWPAPDDWVEAIGVLKEDVSESGYKVLYVDLASLTVKTERGAEFVAT